LAFAASQVLTLTVLRRSGAAWVEALAICGAQSFLQAGFTDQAYVWGARSDALLFLLAQAALLPAIARPTLIGAIAIGALGGVAMNLKIHGALYVFPAFVYC